MAQEAGLRTFDDRRDWRRELTTGARALDDLVRAGHLDAAGAEALREVAARYEMWISRYYLDLIDWSDPACPIRLQALPDARELDTLPTERPDPIGDRPHRPRAAVVRRYPNRALLFPTLRCPMFCRYCFRKVLLNDDPAISLRHDIDDALDWLAGQPEVHEVILSGGDPLMLSDDNLGALLGRLRAIPHVRRLRIHTRVPSTLPMRITPELGALLARHRPLAVVAHFNHPRELTAEATTALAELADAAVPVLDQSVLLRGVNDDETVLAELFEGLMDRNVRPYYLHHPDVVCGTSHFRVPLDRGLELYRSLRGRLSGLHLPQYVMEIPGGGGKVPVDSAFVRPTATPGVWQLTSPLGGEVEWVDPAVHPSGVSGR
jgi:lysine 2,3-aminomutase